jgi:beta-lactamase regulating signal transducer with metallopeptidase domain
MIEHIAPVFYYMGIHLVFSSFVWLGAWIVTSIREGSASTKHWIWVATLLNFVVPLAAILDRALSSHLSWARPIGIIGDVGLAIAHNRAVIVVWMLGATFMFGRLCLRLSAERHHVQITWSGSASEWKIGSFVQGVPVVFVAKSQGPAVAGILRPRISLPVGIEDLLTEHELHAVLLHEVAHAKRRDNLIRLVYETILCILWFHPLVWFTGARLTLFRELSCDESVIYRNQAANLVSALAKLAKPEMELLLQASAASFLSNRLARLARVYPQPSRPVFSFLTTTLFSAVLLGSILETIAHTACCFVKK